MDVIFTAFCCFVFCISIYVVKDKASRLFFLIIGGYWCISLIISLFNPFELYPVSVYAYFLLCLGYSSFFIGYAFNIHGFTKVKSNDNFSSVHLLFNNRLLKFVYLLSFGILFYLATTQWKLIVLQGALGSLKLDFFELVFNNNSILYFSYQTFIFPLFHFSCFLLAFLILDKCVYDKKYILFLAAYAVIFSFVGGKRGYFLIIIEYFLIIFILLNIAFNKAKFWNIIKSSLIITIPSLFIVIGAAFMTALTGGTDMDKDRMHEASSSNAKNLIVYTVGAYRAFDYALNHDYVDKAGGYTLGRATLGGAIDYYGSGVLSRLGFPIEPVRAKTMSTLQNENLTIGNGTDFNFAYTSFMYFYYDFGVIGIVIFSFLFGLFTRGSLKGYSRNRTIGALGLICFLFIACLQFCQNWFNIALSTQPTLLLLYILDKFERKKLCQ